VGKQARSGEPRGKPRPLGRGVERFTFLLLFPFCNPKTIDLHVLMVLVIGEITNTVLLPEMLIVHFYS